MRIKFITTSLAPKGPTRQLSYLTRLNADQDVTFSVNSIRRPRASDWQHLFDETRLDLVFGWRSVLSIRDADVNHTSGLVPDLLGWFLSYFRPWVVTVRNYPHDDYPPKFGKIVGKLLAFTHFQILKRCKNLVFCSYDLKKKFNEAGISGSCIENASLEFFGDPSRFAKQLLYCGSLIERKNIRAMAELYCESALLCEIEFLVFGQGQKSSELPTNRKVIRAGFESDISKIHSRPRIFISLSKSEGMPNAALEALAAGCILILSDIPSHQRLASIFPELIMLVSLDGIDIDVFDHTLNNILVEYHSLDWQNIQNKYNSCYGIPRMKAEYLAIYNEI